MLRPKLVLLLTNVLQRSLFAFFLLPRASETRHLLYFRDTGSYVVRATIQHYFCSFISFSHRPRQHNLQYEIKTYEIKRNLKIVYAQSTVTSVNLYKAFTFCTE